MQEITLTQLGEKTPLPKSPHEAVLERIETTADVVVRMSVPEFTSLCPVTGQPDYARIYLDYHPNGLLIESKSLKLFMGSFRNHGAFHEDCTNLIGVRLWNALQPHWLRVTAFWYPRGGIPIDVVWESGDLASGYHALPLEMKPYDGR